jgi:carbonic anhydrase
MRTQTKESQSNMTPNDALSYLKLGNERFQKNLKANRNLLEQVNDTRESQFPFAAILSCIDSRVSAELVFDQGLGDVFSIRIAGNFVNNDILGSMEFACKVAGSKLIVVLGHTSCGAIKGACDHVKLGNLTGMLDKIQPAVESVQNIDGAKNSKNVPYVNEVARVNVLHAIENIKKQSPVLNEMLENGEIGIVGAMYDVSTGSVEFYGDSENL